jgi:hypothetical protein
MFIDSTYEADVIVEWNSKPKDENRCDNDTWRQVNITRSSVAGFFFFPISGFGFCFGIGFSFGLFRFWNWNWKEFGFGFGIGIGIGGGFGFGLGSVFVLVLDLLWELLFYFNLTFFFFSVALNPFDYHSLIPLLLFMLRISYMELLQQSKFCFLPRGHQRWSYRLVDVLSVGCIPIFVADHLTFPLRPLIPWEKISMHIPEVSRVCNFEFVCFELMY